MIWTIAILLALTALCGMLYRAGGMGDEGRERFPVLPGWFFNTKARDIGCSICSVIGLFVIWIGFFIPW